MNRTAVTLLPHRHSPAGDGCVTRVGNEAVARAQAVIDEVEGPVVTYRVIHDDVVLRHASVESREYGDVGCGDDDDTPGERDAMDECSGHRPVVRRAPCSPEARCDRRRRSGYPRRLAKTAAPPLRPSRICHCAQRCCGRPANCERRWWCPSSGRPDPSSCRAAGCPSHCLWTHPAPGFPRGRQKRCCIGP